MTEEKIINFICDICGRDDFKNDVALKAHKNWHKPGYRDNISKKIKALHKDPTSKYNSPEYREKLRSKNIDSSSSNNPKEVIKFNHHHLEYFSKYRKAHNYFDKKSIVNDYIKNNFNGNRIQPNEHTYIEKSFDMIIENNLEIGKINFYKPPIYRSKRG